MGVASDGPAAPIFKGLLHILVMILHLQMQARLSYCASASDNDSKALLNFKSSLSHSYAFDTWNIQASANPCSGTWKGVLCYNGVVWGLQLENMGLTGQIDIDALVPLRTLRSISLMNNRFEGAMPDWRKLGALKSLFLSHNSFSGQIKDDAFANMTSLKKVHLANNKFIGSIPSSLARPRLLELRLESNGFTGTIPDIRQGLKALNLSNNQLEGPIPQSLINFNPTSFAGNKDLCGKPLESTCPAIPPDDDDEDDLSNSPVEPRTPPSPGESNSVNIVIIVIVGTVVVAAILVLLVIIRRRNRKEVPQLGKAVSSSASIPPSPAAASPIRKQHDLHMHQAGAVERAAAKSSSPEMNNLHVPKKGEPGSKLSFVREDRPQFDLTDLLRASAEVLGSGNLGSSYKAVLLDDQTLVVKRFNQMHNVEKEDFHENMRRLARLEHPNLLPLVAYYYRKEEKLLVYDYIQNGSLASHLHGNHSAEKPALDWPTRLNIIKGVAKGLAYLHRELPASLNTPHGHLKSSNVVLDDGFQPLLMDYGLVPVVNQEQVQNLLVAYKSPEYIKCSRITRKSDVWNLGILILETLTSKFPTNYLTQDGSGHYMSRESSSASSSPAWAGFVGREDFDINAVSVIDAEMENRDNSEGEIIKLLKIGMACCQEDEDKRLDLKEALDEIEAINERDLL